MRGKHAFYAVCSVVLYFLIGFYLDTDQLKDELSRKRGELIVLKQKARELEEVKRQIAELERILPRLKEVLPERTELGSIVETFSSFAREAGLKIKEIDTTQIRRKGVLYEWNVKLRLIAPSYFSFLKFMDNIRALKRNFIPDVVRIDYIPRSPKNSIPKLAIYLELKTYLKPQEG